jgi:hypothetical protein
LFIAWHSFHKCCNDLPAQCNIYRYKPRKESLASKKSITANAENNCHDFGKEKREREKQISLLPNKSDARRRQHILISDENKIKTRLETN